MPDSAAASPAVLPLNRLHERLGARLQEMDGVRVPVAYASQEAEYQALREGCGLVDRSWVSRLELRGEDRLRFLNGLVTCDVARLEAGEGTYGFLTNAQGRILADVAILVLEDRLWLELPPGKGKEIRAHLHKYIVMDRVEVFLLDDMLPLTVAGSRAQELLAASKPLPEAAWGHRRTRVLDSEVHLARHEGCGVPAYTLWTSASIAPHFVEALLEAGGGAGLAPVGYEALETVRCEAGIPRYGLDFGPKNLPQETGLEDAVSFEKGCYLGQEVVARIHFRGQASRQLRGLVFEVGTPPPGGTVLLHDGREAGVIGTVVHSPLLACPIGLAMVHRRAAEPGTRLSLPQGGEVEVRELPFRK